MTPTPNDALLRVAVERDSVEKIIAEMRDRKINHGRNTSPTLHAWADRLAAFGAAAGEPTDRCRCGAPCRKEVLERGGEHGWGDDASRTVLRYVPPLPAAAAARVPGEIAMRLEKIEQFVMNNLKAHGSHGAISHVRFLRADISRALTPQEGQR